MLPFAASPHIVTKGRSWLNIAEIELSALQRGYLSRRIPDMEIMKKEVNAWVQKRNERPVKIPWQFSSSDAAD